MLHCIPQLLCVMGRLAKGLIPVLIALGLLVVMTIAIGADSALATDDTSEQLANVAPTAQHQVVVTPTTVTVSNAVTVRAGVYNAGGQPEKGVPVTFTLQGSGTLYPVFRETDKNGIARTIYTASTTAGSVQVRATALGVTGVATVIVEAGSAAQITMTAQPAMLPADGVSTSTIQAFVRDVYGNLKGNQRVSFLASGGDLQPGATNTDATGSITRTLRSSSVAGAVVVTATAIPAQATMVLTFTSGAANKVTLTATPPQIVADGNTTSTITALVNDATNNAVSSVAVAFLQTAGSGVLLGGTLQTTGPDGRASIVLQSATVIQTSTIKAELVGQISNTIHVPFIAGSPALVRISSNPQTIEATTSATTTVIVTVTDRVNHPNVGTPVTLTTTAGMFPSGVRVHSATTNATGVVQTVLSASSELTVATITAFASGIQSTTQVAFSVGLPATLTVLAMPATLTANGVQTSTIRAEVLDRNSHPISGTQVSLVALLGNVAPVSVLTGADGRATALFTARTIAGQARVTATILSGLFNTTGITLVAGAPATLTLAVAPQELQVGASTHVSAFVRDRYTNPVSGTPVMFGVPDALGHFVDFPRANTVVAASRVVTSDGEGIARALLVTTGIGTGTVTASVAGLQQRSVDLVVKMAQVMLPMVVRYYPPQPLPELINGDFEDGRGQGWTETLIEGPDDPMVVRCDSVPDQVVSSGCGDSYLAWLGGRRVKQIMVISQTTSSLPAVYPAQVKFRYFTFSDRPGTECDRDYARVLANDVEIRRYSLCSTQDTNAWTADLVNLANFSGQPLTLKFNIVLSGGRLGNFFIDDVALCSDSDLAPDGTPPCAGTQVQADVMAGDLAEAETAGASVRPDESAPQETPETEDGADQRGVDLVPAVDGDAGSQPSPPDAGEQDNNSDE